MCNVMDGSGRCILKPVQNCPHSQGRGSLIPNPRGRFGSLFCVSRKKQVTAGCRWGRKATGAPGFGAHVPRPQAAAAFLPEGSSFTPVGLRLVKSLPITTLVKSHLLPPRCRRKCGHPQVGRQTLGGEKHTAGTIGLFGSTVAWEFRN